MKFPITQEQYDALEELVSLTEAARLTLYVALERHEDISRDLTSTSDAVWDEMKETHQLSDVFNWQITVCDGKPYVESVEKDSK